MRKSVLIAAGLVLATLAASTPASAICVGSYLISQVAPGYSMYTYRQDVADAWGGTYNGNGVLIGPGQSLSPNVRGSYWVMGSGAPGAGGIDNGTFPAASWFAGGGAYGGGQYYAFFIDTQWSQALEIDGCIDAQPAGSCVFIALSDEDSDGDGYFALLSKNSEGNFNTDLTTLGDIVLRPAPKPRITGSTRISNSQVDLDVALDSVPSDPASGLYLDCGQGSALQGFRLYKQNVPRNAPAPSSRDLSALWQPVGVQTAPGGTSSISVTCSGDEDVYLTAELVYEGGFTQQLGSSNGTAVQCGPTLVDPVKPIHPPKRGKPAGVTPRSDRGTR